MPAFGPYDPGLHGLVFRGILIQGFADGSHIAVARDEDSFTKSTGSDGGVVRTRNRNKGGSIRFTLQAESPTNDFLSEVMLEDENFGTGFGPAMVSNALSRSLHESAIAWLKRPADQERAKEAGNVEWMLDCAELECFVGGAVGSIG